MDPFTHAVVGIAAGSFSGSNVLSNPLAIGCLIGSVLPDSDIIFQYWGDYSYLKNHRGVTHSLPGMAALSALISLAVLVLFPGAGYLNILLWTFLGCLTHVGLDVFNSYGAKVLWPLYDKKIGTGLMLIFDPFLILCAMAVYWQNRIGAGTAWIGIGGFGGYLLVRQGMKGIARRRLLWTIPVKGVRKVVLLPSMSGFFKWDFIIHGKRQIVTGYVDLLGRRAAVRDRLMKPEGQLQKKVMDTALGRFFKEFAQEYHIACERKDGQHHIIITDLRYYIRNRYMHHASALFNQKMELIQCAFHPYHEGRNAKLPKSSQTA